MKQEEIKMTVPLNEIIELQRLMSKIQIPDVTYCDDLLPMAQQAIRLSRRYAERAQDILFTWRGVSNY